MPHEPLPDVDRKSKSSVVEVVTGDDVDVEDEVLDDVDELLVDEVDVEDVDVDELVLDDVDELVDEDVLDDVELDVDDVVVTDVLVDVDDDVLEDDVDVLLVVELDVDEVEVDDVEVDEVEVDDVEVDDVLVELDVLLLVDDELVLLVLDVVVVWFGLQRGSSGLANSGTAAASMQSTLNFVTQSTQSTMSPASTIAPPQLDGMPSNGAPYGQFAGKPMAEDAMSGLPPQTLSVPPHALQMVRTFFVSAFERRRFVFPVASVGHCVA